MLDDIKHYAAVVTALTSSTGVVTGSAGSSLSQTGLFDDISGVGGQSSPCPTDRYTQFAHIDWLASDAPVGCRRYIDLHLPRRLCDASLCRQALSDFKNHPFWWKIPQNIQHAIESNRDLYRLDGRLKQFIKNDKLYVVCDKNGFYTVAPLSWRAVSVLDAPKDVTPLNPKTRKPWVQLDGSCLHGLNSADVDYIRRLLKAVNYRIHYLGAAPVPRLSVDKIKRGVYLFSVAGGVTLYRADDLVALHRRNDRPQTHLFGSVADLREALTLKNKVDWGIAQRLGIPVFQPQQFMTDDSLHVQTYANGLTEIRSCGFRYFCLGWSAFESDPKLAFASLYRSWFGEVSAGACLMRAGLKAEKEMTRMSDPRFEAVRLIVRQAKHVLTHIAREAEKYRHLEDVCKNLPRCILVSKEA